ncbi:MAG: hypothetical protein IKF38_02085 [Clostridia bacterium]|nr:hypothetical protein [Clostridia bacterium]
MKHGKRIENKEKIKLTPEQKSKKKKLIKRVFFTILIILILLIGAYIANDFIILDKNEKTNLVINNKNITSNLKNDIIIENETIYLSKDDIANFFDKYIYLEKESNEIITTYDKKIASIGFEEKTININGAHKKIYAHAENKNNTIYLPISEMKDVYGIDVEYNKESNVITMDSVAREQKKAMVAKGAAVKSTTGFISKTVDRIEQGGYVIVISKTDDGWTKIRTKNGKVGYVKNDCIANEVTIRENMEEEKQINGKVNMVWDYFSQYKTAPDRSEEKIDGVNVVSPAFFYIDSKGKFNENVGNSGKKYIEWAHNNGYKVWAMVSNSYETNMIEPTSTIMNSYKKRQALIEEIVDGCVKYELDGINIDFENMKQEDKDMYSRFIIELTPRLKEIGAVVSVDVTAPDGGETWSMCFDRHIIGNVADYIVFMAYDEYSSSSTKAGTTAGYNWVELNLNKFLKTEEIDSDKIILALPFYTVLWTEGSNGKATGNVVNMKDINNVIPNNVKKEWKEDLKQNYVEFEQKGSTKKMWIEDLDSIKEKLSLVKSKNLAGVAGWAKDREDPDVWKVIENELK